MGGKLIRTVGQVRANFAVIIMVVSHTFKCLVCLKLAGIRPFGVLIDPARRCLNFSASQTPQ